jgi:hypothetical protein
VKRTKPSERRRPGVRGAHGAAIERGPHGQAGARRRRAPRSAPSRVPSWTCSWHVPNFSLWMDLRKRHSTWPCCIGHAHVSISKATVSVSTRRHCYLVLVQCIQDEEATRRYRIILILRRCVTAACMVTSRLAHTVILVLCRIPCKAKKYYFTQKNSLCTNHIFGAIVKLKTFIQTYLRVFWNYTPP